MTADTLRELNLFSSIKFNFIYIQPDKRLLLVTTLLRKPISVFICT